MKYNLNKIGNDYQVYGEVNGFITYEVESPIYNVYRYIIRIKFFIGSRLVKVESRGCTSQMDINQNQDKIEKIIKERIDKTIKEEELEYENK